MERLTVEQQTEIFNEIGKIHDYAEIIKNYLKETDTHPQEQKIVTPFVNQLDESLLTIEECYANFLEHDQSLNQDEMKNLEKSLRGFFKAADDVIHYLNKFYKKTRG